jgi:hypothetical protein
MREAASNVSAWQRTEMLLLGPADHWEETAKQEDIRSKQLEMREWVQLALKTFSWRGMKSVQLTQAARVSHPPLPTRDLSSETPFS